MESKQNFSEVKQNEIGNIGSFKHRSKSIAIGGVYTEGHQSELMPSDRQDD